MSPRILTAFLLSAFVGIVACPSALARNDQTIELIIKDHKFSNEKLKVKANETFKIKITNEDITSEEFESKSMLVEKFITPKRTLTLTLGPLKPGSYDFFGDFHQATAKGVLVAE